MQYDNFPIPVRIGSASLELNEDGGFISYEEYHPFGTTSYRSGKSAAEVSLKRYKYVGKERDEETGLYYYGARYYSAWLGRFVSVDPLAIKRRWLNPYNYVQNNPLNKIDPTGMLDTDPPKGSNPELNQVDPDVIQSNNGSKLSGVPDIDEGSEKQKFDINDQFKSLKFAGEAEYNAYMDYKNEVKRRVSQQKENHKGFDYNVILDELNAIENSEDFVFVMRTGENRKNSTIGSGGGVGLDASGKININFTGQTDFTEIQNIAHELKHAFQLVDGKLAVGPMFKNGNNGNYTYDFQDEKEAYIRGDLFAEKGKSMSDTAIDELIFRDYVRGQDSKFDYSGRNITVSDFKASFPEKMNEIINYNRDLSNHNMIISNKYSGWKNDIRR